MFYLKDVYFRILYILVSFIIALFIIYFYKEELVFLLILPSWFSKFKIEYFIFTEPKEIFLFYFYSFFLMAFIYIFPLIIFTFYDYLKPAVYKSELKYIIMNYKYFFNIYIIANILVFFIFFPIFWNFFSSFDKNSHLVVFFLELSAINYFKFLFSTFFLSNSLIILILILLKIFIKKGVYFLLEAKKYIIFLFLIFSTVLTPPELELQIFLFCFLYIKINY
jgi:sec-independent protein translocase protein TatC